MQPSPGQLTRLRTGNQGGHINIDTLDRGIITELQRDGRATWNEIAKVVGTTGTTVARRTGRLVEVGAIRVVGAIDPLRCGLGYPILVRIRTLPRQIRTVADVLADRSDVRFLAVVTGTSDIVAELIVASRADMARVLMDELDMTDGIAGTTAATVMRHYKLSYHERPQQGEVLVTNGGDGTPGSTKELDDLGRAIADQLALDGRMPIATLSENLGISESMARRRVDSLVSSGQVGISTLLDASMLGYEVEVLLWLGVDLSCLSAVADQLCHRPEVRYLAAAAGDAELVAEVLCRDQEDLYRFTTEVLGPLEGIRRTELMLQLQAVKRAWVRLNSAPAG